MAVRGSIVAGVVTAVLAAPGWVSPEPGDAAALAVREVGAVATADRIAVVVPGAGTHADHLDRIDQPSGMARALVEEAGVVAPERELAAVAWAGYHAPTGVSVGVVRAEYARAGAERLERYLDRLAARTEAPMTLFCHSYGSVVCGHTELKSNVTDVVLFGSPGTGLRAARELDARVWAARMPDDWIRFVPSVRVAGLGHGVDPTSPEFGARVVATGPSGGHGDYLAPGTLSRRNFARIAIGAGSAVTCASPPAGALCHAGA